MTERVRSFTPIDVAPLPRPPDRFGAAFPVTLAETYTAAYSPRRGVVLDPLAHPWSATDAAEHCDRRGVAPPAPPPRAGGGGGEGGGVPRLEERGLAYWQMVERFGSDQALGESVAGLYTPRNL